MARSLVLGLSLLALPLSVLAQEGTPRVVSLEEVLRAVKQNNGHLQAAAAQVEVAEGQKQKAWTAWQPNVSAIGQVSFTSVKTEFTTAPLLSGAVHAVADAFRGIVDVPPDRLAQVDAQLAQQEPVVLQPYVSLAAMLTAKQTLFNITALRAPGVAAKGVHAAKLGAEAAEDEILYQAAQVYLGLQGLKELEAASARAIEVAAKRIQDARVQLEAGTATKLAVTRAETDKIVAEGQMSAMQQQRRSLLALLQALMASDERIEVSAEPLEASLSLESQGGIEDRSSLRARVAAMEAADAAIGLNNLSWLPTLAADGALRYSNVEGFSGEKFIATANLSLIVPLYDSGLRYAETRIAEAQALQAKRELEAARLEAKANLEDAESKLTTANVELAQAKAQLKLAEEAVAQVEALVKNGLATSLDLTDADSKRFGADRLAVQKGFELSVAKLGVKKAKGAKLLKD